MANHLLFCISLWMLIAASASLLAPDVPREMKYTTSIGNMRPVLAEKFQKLKANLHHEWTLLVSEQCGQDVQTLLDGIERDEIWALAFLDSWGLPGSNTIGGNTKWIGAYGQCVRAEGRVANRTIKGKHCMAEIGFGPFFDYGFGVCFPHTCSSSEVFELLKAGLTIIDVEEGMDTWCTEPPSLSKSPGAIALLAVSCFFIFLVSAATAFHIFRQRRKSKEQAAVKGDEHINLGFVGNGSATDIAANGGPEINLKTLNKTERNGVSGTIPNGTAGTNTAEGGNTASVNAANDKPVLVFSLRGKSYDLTDPEKGSQTSLTAGKCTSKLRDMLLSFSLSKNAVFVMDENRPAGSFACLDGIRFLSMAWILLGHSWEIGITLSFHKAVTNTNEVVNIFHKTFLHQILHHMNLGVETFFFMGAFLLTVSFFKGMKRIKGKVSRAFLNLPLLYLHRYLRLTPVYAFLIWFFASVYPLVGLGPLHLPNMFSDDCQSDWWANLLYINNFKQDKACFMWGWYLAIDFQFYLLAPFVLILLYKSRKAGLFVMAFLWIGTLVANLVVWHFIIFKGTLNAWNDEYTKPWTRVGPYLIGMFVGYVYNETKFKFKMSRLVVATGWIVGIALTAIPVFVSHNHRCNNCEGNWTRTGHMVFNALHRNVFTLGLAWIVVACCSGYGGIINRVLSSKYFGPLSKLSYLGYLVHPMVHGYTMFERDVMPGITIWFMLYMVIGNMVLTLFLSLVLTLVIELPILNLKDVLLPRVMSSK